MPDSILDVDVAIIGGGGAGIPAAIEVARGESYSFDFVEPFAAQPAWAE